MNKRLRIACVAAEASGDALGAALFEALSKQADIEVYGIAGPKMSAVGVQALWPSEALAVNVFSAVLGRLFSILRIRRQLKRNLLKNPPDLFIGIDGPDFNFSVEKALSQAKVPVIHYVSPAVWAWRSGRLKTIRKITDLVLLVFPFEPEIYQANQIAHAYVGHPLAASAPLFPRTRQARLNIGIAASEPVFTIMPGSRACEVKRHESLVVAMAHRIQQEVSHARLLIPCANEKIYHSMQALFANQPAVLVLKQQSLQAIEAANVVLVACGTAALECMLYKKPMVVFYRGSRLDAALVRLFLDKEHWFSLPNFFHRGRLVPEFISTAPSEQEIVAAALGLWRDVSWRRQLRHYFLKYHQDLGRGDAQVAANAVISFLKEREKDADLRCG